MWLFFVISAIFKWFVVKLENRHVRADPCFAELEFEIYQVVPVRKKLLRATKRTGLGFLLAILAVVFQESNGLACEINDMLAIGGVAAGIYQYQDLNDSPDYENQGRGLLVFQPEISFTPTENDEVFAKLGFGVGDGLMGEGRSPFIIAPWGGEIQDDYININGRSRDYLLTSWYKHTFRFSGDHTLGLTGGIIDSTDYLDQNAFSNDEYTQFLNGALVNGPNAFMPSYDMGGAVEWQIGALSLNGVVMALGDTGAPEPYNEPYSFFGFQAGYTIDSSLGEGNYRLIVDFTSESFPDPTGRSKERKIAAIASFDQQLGEVLGVWIRSGYQDDHAGINYKGVYSGGLNISGKLWSRELDNVGVGYAYLGGGNLEVDHSEVFEVYGRFGLNSIFAITGDIQYMKDAMKEGESPAGWILGMRLTAEF